MSRILLIFQSRRFVSAVAVLLVSILISLVPELEAMRETLVTIALVLGFTLIAGYSAEDVTLARQKASQPPTSVNDQAHEVLASILELLTHPDAFPNQRTPKSDPVQVEPPTVLRE